MKNKKLSNLIVETNEMFDDAERIKGLYQNIEELNPTDLHVLIAKQYFQVQKLASKFEEIFKITENLIK